jgi:uncharacterized membrane protein
VRKPFRAAFEPLEDRCLLDGTPPSLVVGRTLSSYFVGDVQNNQETITYTVYNPSGEAETGVLLTTTLDPGVTFSSASQQPDQSGPNLAWSLGTIEAFARASVTLTVTLASPTPTQLATGAEAFAFLEGAAVTAATPAATLSAAAPPVSSLLASTPDANTADPYIQEEAAELDYNAQNIFNFLHQDIGYNDYAGSMRGARGTLWSMAGDALDVASLGVALLRASGIPAQYAEGTLTEAQAQQLILLMFPAPYQLFGYLPAGTATSDPADDPDLLADAEPYYWIQFGSSMEDADPLLSSAIGQAATTATGTFAAVPDALEETTEVTLTAQIYDQGAAALGVGDGLSETVVLDRTFDDVALVGHPLTIGNFVNSTTVNTLTVASTTNTYTPYLAIGDLANPDPSQDELITGQSYQDVLTTFPLSSQAVVGLYLDVTLSGPEGPSQTYDRALVNLLGASGPNGGSVSVSINPNGPPTINANEVWSMSVLPGLIDPSAAISVTDQAPDEYNALGAALASGDPALLSGLLNDVLIAQSRSYLYSMLDLSDLTTEGLAQAALVAAYFDRPRITLVSAAFTVGETGTAMLSFEADLRDDSVTAIAYPGESSSSVPAFQFTRGFAEDAIETNVFPGGSPPPGVEVSPPVSASAVLSAADAQDIPIVMLTPADPAMLDELDIDSQAMAGISDALQQGLSVMVPASDVTIGGQTTCAWFEVNTTTGEVIGVGEDGAHQATQEFGFILNTSTLASASPAQQSAFGRIAAKATISFLLQGAVLHKALFSASLGPAYFLADGVTYNNAPIKTLNATLMRANQAIGKEYKSFTSFVTAYQSVINNFIAKNTFDPPVPPTVGGDPAVSVAVEANEVSVPAGSLPPAAAVAGTVATPSLAVTGQIEGSWTTGATNGFSVDAIDAAAATVTAAGTTTVGSGTIALATGTATPVTLSGNVTYQVSGQGSLSFYGAAETSLGVSGEWSNYSLAATGNITIQVTTDALTLNGSPLPAGTYTLTTSSATLSGSGASTEPDFSGSASISAAGATVTTGPGAGTLSAGGTPLDPTQALSLTGYTGTLSIMAGGGNNTDSVTLSGTASDSLQVAPSPAALSTIANTPVVFAVRLQTSLADTYYLTAVPPAGWSAAIDAGGNVTVTPAPGAAPGTYAVQVVAQSATDPDLIVQTVALVTITPTSAGFTLAVAVDPLSTVPFNGAQIPSAFQATVQNTGPAPDTYTLKYSGIPAGFALLDSAASLTVPAGATGSVGLYLMPTGQAPPAVGTMLTITVTATSTNNLSLAAERQSVEFTVPAIDDVGITAPATVDTTPGVSQSATITLTNNGNVPENDVAVTATSSSSLVVTTPAPVALMPGQSTTATVTLTPTATTALNSFLQTTVTATFGPAGNAQTQTAIIVVGVVVPGADAIGNASLVATAAGNTPLATVLGNLSNDLTTLVMNPASAVDNAAVTADIASIASQVGSAPFLSGSVGPLYAAAAAITAADTASEVKAAATSLGQAMATLDTDLTREGASQFTMFLDPDRGIALAGAPTTYDVDLRNTGSTATTYDLSVSGLPAGVTASFNETSVTLQPGQQVGGAGGVVLSLSETEATLVPANFTVTVTATGASNVTLSVPGELELNTESIAVSSVTTSVPYVQAGTSVAVAAVLQVAVNEPRPLSASYTVTNPAGTAIYTSPVTIVPVTAASSALTVPLGSFATTGLADGLYGITIALTDTSAQPLPSATGTGSVIVGLPVSASFTVSPSSLPEGSGSVTDTVQVNAQTTLPDPLTLLGGVSTPGPGTTVALFGNYAYEATTAGIEILNIGNPNHPTVAGSLTSTQIFTGAPALNFVQVAGGDLYVASDYASQSLGFNLLVYSLTAPASPQLLGSTAIPYPDLGDLLLNSTATDAYIPTQSVQFEDFDRHIIDQGGTFVSVDLSDPTQPGQSDVLFNDQGPETTGTTIAGGDVAVNGAALQSDDLAYLATTTSEGGDVEDGTGEVDVVDTSDPTQLAVVGTPLQIPSTVQLSDIAIDGNYALVVGNTGGYTSPVPEVGTDLFDGNVTLTLLDISDPQNPTIVGTTQVLPERLPGGDIGSKVDVEDLGNGIFAVSNTVLDGTPQILVVGTADPTNLSVAAIAVPSVVHGVTAANGLLYATTAQGLSIYQIGTLVSVPITISVDVADQPAAKTTAVVAPGSYNTGPDQTTPGTNFDTVVWNRALAYGNSSATFTWQTAIGNLGAAQSEVIAQNASVSFINQSTPGTIALPSLSVTGASIVAVTPATQTVPPGAPATYDVRLSNPTDAAVTYELGAQGFAFTPDDFSIPATVTVGPEGTADVTLTVTTPDTESP